MPNASRNRRSGARRGVASRRVLVRPAADRTRPPRRSRRRRHPGSLGVSHGLLLGLLMSAGD